MKHIAWAAVVAAAVCGAAPSSVAETLEEAIDSYRPGDYARASEFFLPLAHRGNAAAQESLGFMYADGRGVPRDYVQAYLWISLALAQAEGEAADRRRMTLAGIEAKMTPAEIAEARSLACAWTPKKLQV
jgi:hypothetical protein